MVTRSEIRAIVARKAELETRRNAPRKIVDLETFACRDPAARFGTANVLEPDAERELQREMRGPEVAVLKSARVLDHDTTKQEAKVRARAIAEQRKELGRFRRHIGELVGRRWDQRLECWVLDHK